MTHPYKYTGPHHPYYENGRTYHIGMQRTRFLRRIEIAIPRGYHGDLKPGSYVKYRNLKQFYESWEAVRWAA